MKNLPELEKAARVEPDKVALRFKRVYQSLWRGAVLRGAWRCDLGPCIPCDCMRMPMLAFYGLPIQEH